MSSVLPLYLVAPCGALIGYFKRFKPPNSIACSSMPTGKAHAHIGCFLKWFSKFAAVSAVGLSINAFSNLFMLLPLVYLGRSFSS